MQIQGHGRGRRGFTLIEVILVVAIIGFVLAIGVPNLMKARDTSQTDICYSNLRLIHAAVQRWAVENNKSPADTVTKEDLMPYFAKNKWPACPGGGTYTLKTVNDLPECSLKDRGHDYQQ